MGSITKNCDAAAIEDYNGSKNHISYFNENIRHLTRECKNIAINNEDGSEISISDLVSIDQARLKAKNKYLIEVNKGKSPRTSIIYASIEIFKTISSAANDKNLLNATLEKALERLDVEFCEIIENS